MNLLKKYSKKCREIETFIGYFIYWYKIYIFTYAVADNHSNYSSLF